MHIICGEAVMCRTSAELQRQGLGQARLQTDTEAPEYELSWSSAAVFTLTHFFSFQGPECNTFSYSLLGVV